MRKKSFQNSTEYLDILGVLRFDIESPDTLNTRNKEPFLCFVQKQEQINHFHNSRDEVEKKAASTKHKSL